MNKEYNLADKEMEGLQNIVVDTLASICAMADKFIKGYQTLDSEYLYDDSRICVSVPCGVPVVWL